MEFTAFPYEPYSIQMDFMNFLYKSLDKGGISMLESPTGTGKTLSIICSALQWLVDRKNSKMLLESNEIEKSRDDSNDVDDDEPDWMKTFVPNNEPVPAVRKNSTVRDEKVRDLFSGIKQVKSADGEVEEEFLLEEYDSGGEDGGKVKRKNGGFDDYSSDEEDDEFAENEEEEKVKVYFCSRTHSQLSQFVKELRKTRFGKELKVVSLASRKNYCINEDVLKLGSIARINERCSELQKNKNQQASKMKKLGARRKVNCKKASCGCPMLKNRKIKDFKNEVNKMEALDIEDLVGVGRKLGSCPYYGSRKMLPVADLVILPYQSLLSKSSRDSLGLNLKNNVVIIDEAHNLADTLTSMYNAKITLPQLSHLQSCLNGYFQRFCNLLGPGNRRYIQTLMVLTQAFLKALCESHNINSRHNTEVIKSASNTSMTVNEFLFALNIDNINLVKLLRYIKESNIIYKVSGYAEKVDNSQKSSTAGETEDVKEESAISGFRALTDLLSSLTNKDSDGKIIISLPRKTCNAQEGGYIKYVMLTGEKIFSQVVDQAHAVILAGGTLQPIEETKERLFPSLQLDQMPFFSCGHIIPSENILPIAIKCGPSGQSFDFSYKARSSTTMIEELGLLLCNISIVVPEGIVVFLSSFDYESKVYDTWESSGILSRIKKRKRIFREPRKSSEIEAVLTEYKDTIDELSKNPTSCNGAIILAVVGGKISEGINFSDGAGRCIVMVGLPYPSPSDIELIERVKHIEGLQQKMPNNYGKCLNGDLESGFQVLRSCKGRGKEYYENLCMKAVNQSIGRAIRHVNDYAAILLVDARYASDPTNYSSSHSTDKLPRWIKNSLVTSNRNYGEIHKSLHQFFKFHKNKEKRQSTANLTG